jgi:hypothetical protein
MTSIQYIDAQGVFIGSYQEGTPCEVAGATIAPADADGFHGMEGLRWDGSAWVQYTPPPDSCTALQGRRALGMERVQQISALVAHLDLVMPYLSAEEVWEIQTAWEFATTWDRLGREVNMLRDIFGMSEAERDDLMRLAVTL